MLRFRQDHRQDQEYSSSMDIDKVHLMIDIRKFLRTTAFVFKWKDTSFIRRAMTAIIGSFGDHRRMHDLVIAAKRWTVAIVFLA